MAILNIVMCRRNEPIKLLHDFMQMLMQQRNVNREDVEITLIQLNSGNNEFEFNNDIDGYSIDYIVARHDSITKAYNQHIVKTDAQWIMFVDYGDMFTDIYSLSMILNLVHFEAC